MLTSDLDSLVAALRAQALLWRDMPCIGRSHGMHAEPTTFGLKLLGHMCEFARDRERVAAAQEEMAAPVDEALGAQRDRYAAYACVLGITAAGVERLAQNVRHLTLPEIAELAAPRWDCDDMVRLARTAQAAVVPCLKDAIHPSGTLMEDALQGATTALHTALERLCQVVVELEPNLERMLANIDATDGWIYGQPVLLALIECGVPKMEAYRVIQRCAHKTDNFRKCLADDPLSAPHLEAVMLAFDPRVFTRHVPAIFERVLG